MSPFRYFILLLTCLASPLMSNKTLDNEQTVKAISIMEACMQGNFKKIDADTLEYPHFETEKPMLSPASEVEELLSGVNNAMWWKRSGWEATPFEIYVSRTTNDRTELFFISKAQLMNNPDNLAQLQMIRWYDEWRSGRDLTEPFVQEVRKLTQGMDKKAAEQWTKDNEQFLTDKINAAEQAIQPVIKQRFALLKALKSKNVDAIESACQLSAQKQKPESFLTMLNSNKLSNKCVRLVYLKMDIPGTEPAKETEA